MHRIHPSLSLDFIVGTSVHGFRCVQFLLSLILYPYVLESASDWPVPDETIPMSADGMLTTTAVLPGEGKTSFEALMKTPQDVRDYFGKCFPAAFGPDGPNEEVATEFLEVR